MQSQIFSTQVKANRKSIKLLPLSLKRRLNLIVEAISFKLRCFVPWLLAAIIYVLAESIWRSLNV